MKDNLIERARAADEDALTTLRQRHGPDLRRRTDVRQPWQARVFVDDIMQVTYVQAFLQIKECQSETPAEFIAWLRLIAQKQLRDAIDALEAENPGDSA